MFEENQIPVFRVTLKKVIERLSNIKCEVSELQDIVMEQFDGYEYQDCEDVVGFDKWRKNFTDGEYQLNVKIDHPDAYELTLYVKIINNNAEIYNVL